MVEFATPESRSAPIYIYDRLDEPSRGMLEENLAAPEGGEVAVTCATRMAAVSGALGVLTAGDQIVAHQTLYGCTHSLLTSWLPRYKMCTNFCDLTKPESLAKVATKNCRVVYLETPVSPTMELIDLRAFQQVLDRLNDGRPEPENIRIVVDNTFATPDCQRPLQHGIDIVVHSHQGYRRIRHGDGWSGDRLRYYLIGEPAEKRDAGGRISAATDREPLFHDACFGS